MVFWVCFINLFAVPNINEISQLMFSVNTLLIYLHLGDIYPYYEFCNLVFQIYCS